MREKIAETTCSICKFKSWCEFDARERNAGVEVDAIADCPHITALLALFTASQAAETQAMREALEHSLVRFIKLKIANVVDTTKEIDLIDTVLGGK